MKTFHESREIHEIAPQNREFKTVQEFVDAMGNIPDAPVVISNIENIEDGGRKAAICTGSDGQFYVLDTEDGCVVCVYDSADMEDARDIALRYLKSYLPNK